MKTNLKTEWMNLLIVAIPFIYLAVIWSSLPETVPIHWNAKGEADNWGNKNTLWLLPIALPLLTYGLMLVIPQLDPKKKIEQMGKKYQQLKLILTLTMSALATIILYAALHVDSFEIVRGLLALIGLMFIVLGNYFQTLKPNYFIGIRTPWTLENETVWKETHRFGAKLWVIGGMVTVFSVLIIPHKEAAVYTCIGIASLLGIIPLVYSYQKFQKEKQQSHPIS